jgi:hypothetical protein
MGITLLAVRNTIPITRPPAPEQELIIRLRENARGKKLLPGFNIFLN